MILIKKTAYLLNRLIPMLIIALALSGCGNTGDPGGILSRDSESFAVKQGEVQILPGEIFEFGSPQFTKKQLTFTIENNGDTDLYLTGTPLVDVYGDSSSMFKVLSQPSNLINSGGKTSFVLEFLPTASGDLNAEISIPNNDSLNKDFSFTVQGNKFYQWGGLIGGESGEVVAAYMCTDQAGNVYLTRTFQTSVDFDPTSGEDIRIESDGHVFITRLNADGSYGWTRDFGGPDLIRPNSIHCDQRGGIFVAGTFQGTVDFDPDPSVENSISAIATYDMYISKFTTGGEYVWTRTMGGTDNSEIFDVTSDDSGNVFIAGWFRGDVDFDFRKYTDVHSSNGESDIFITKITADGSYGWTKSFGGEGNDFAKKILLDSNFNIIVYGNFVNTVDFDPESAEGELSTNQGGNVFFLKLDPDGEFIWVLNSAFNDRYADIMIDQDDNILVTDDFIGLIDFDPTTGVDEISVNNSSGFLLKINSNGSYGGTKVFTGSGSMYPTTITMDKSGSVFISGELLSIIDFDPDPAAEDLKDAGTFNDTFLTKLNPDLSYAYTVIFGNETRYVMGWDISADSFGNLFINGGMADTVDFDPGDELNNLTTPGYNEMFVIKLHP